LNKKLKKWSDRHKIVHEPLFRGYVFVQPSDDQKLIVQQVSGVVNFVYWNGKPAVVRPDEIETIQRFLNEFEEVEVEPIDIGVNQRVVVRKGLLINHQGIVLELLGNKVKVLIESMGLKLSATVDKKNLEVI
jgi:transcription antitermination factor NusG